MPQWIPLDATAYATAGWHKYSSYQFAVQDHLAPVLMAEITQLLPWYPLAFLSGDKRYHLVALQSLQPGRNLYVSPQGKWQAPYVPSHYRGYPFGLNAQGQLTLNPDSGLLAEAADEEGATPFFTDAGELSDTAAKVRQFLETRQQGLALTQKLVNQLAEHDLLEPWPVRWQADGQPQTIKGYYCTNEECLRHLPPAAYAELAQSGALGLAYAQIFSQARLADLHYRHQRQAQAQPQPAPDNLDSLFGNDDEELRFDFDN